MIGPLLKRGLEELGVTEEFFICKTNFVVNFFGVVSLHFTSVKSNSQNPTVNNLSSHWWGEEKKKHLKWHWNCSERFGVHAQRSPCTCMFAALSLAKVRPPLLDKCKAFSVLSTSCWPVSVQFFLLPSEGWEVSIYVWVIQHCNILTKE